MICSQHIVYGRKQHIYIGNLYTGKHLVNITKCDAVWNHYTHKLSKNLTQKFVKIDHYNDAT